MQKMEQRLIKLCYLTQLTASFATPSRTALLIDSDINYLLSIKTYQYLSIIFVMNILQKT